MAAASTLDVVRRAVRGVVRKSPALRDQPALERNIAEKLVRVSMAAAHLIAEEQRMNGEIQRRAERPAAVAAAPFAAAQAASEAHGRSATNAAAGTLRATRDAIDFPGFVTSLISGVFQAITNSSLQQMQAFSDLLEAVDASTGQFAASQITDAAAVEWLLARFPVFTADGAAEDGESSEEDGSGVQLSLRENAEMPPAADLASTLGASRSEVSGADPSDLGEVLLPLARRKLAQNRQAMLATMVLMGMQRIVVDEGRIHASMDLQVDARSTAEQQRASRTDTRVSTEAAGSFGTGVWGASAKLSATVGYVRSDQEWSREDLAVRAGLRSSVDVTFRTDQIPLDRMASRAAIERMRSRSRSPETESELARGRESLLSADERRTTTPTFDPIPAPRDAPDPGSAEQRELRARRDMGPSGGEAAPSGGGEAPAEAPAEGGETASAPP